MLVEVLFFGIVSFFNQELILKESFNKFRILLF